MIKHVTIDLWGTLIKGNPEYKKNKALYLKQKYDLGHSIEDIIKVWKKVDKYFTQRDMKVGKHGLLEDRLLAILEVLGICPMNAGDLYALHEDLEALFLEYPPLIYDDHIEKCMNFINQHVDTVSLISNTGIIGGSTLRVVLTNLGIDSFDNHLFSDECLLSKPNVAIFNKALDCIKGATCDEVLHIGDDLIADGVGARRAGFQHFMVNGFTEHTLADACSFIDNN